MIPAPRAGETDRPPWTIATAEEEVARWHVEVENAATDHVALTTACKGLEEAQAMVEQLYARWEELEAKKNNA